MKALSKTFLIAFFASLSLISCKKSDQSDPAPAPYVGITEWTLINADDKDTLSDVFATSSSTVYACTANGWGVYKSTNGGKDWVQNNMTNGGWSSGIYFTDANVGYMSGNNSIPATTWKTSDAGTSWDRQSLPTTSTYTSHGVHFPSASTGYEIGDAGETYKTTDAGATWVLKNTGSSENLHSLYFTSNTTGYVGGTHNTLMKTTDGGSTWNVLNTGLSADVNSVIQSIYFLNANTGYITGGNAAMHRNISGSAPSFILKTTYGGTTWSVLSNPAVADNLSDIYFSDANIGYCIGGSTATNTSTVLKTTDGGTTWIDQPVPGLFLTKMSFADGVLFCVGNNGTVIKGE